MKRSTGLEPGWGRVEVVMKSGQVWNLKYRGEEYSPMVFSLTNSTRGNATIGNFKNFTGVDGTTVFINLEEVEGFNFVAAD